MGGVAEIMDPFAVFVYQRREERIAKNATFYYTPVLVLDPQSPRAILNRLPGIKAK